MSGYYDSINLNNASLGNYDQTFFGVNSHAESSESNIANLHLYKPTPMPDALPWNTIQREDMEQSLTNLALEMIESSRCNTNSSQEFQIYNSSPEAQSIFSDSPVSSPSIDIPNAHQTSYEDQYPAPASSPMSELPTSPELHVPKHPHDGRKTRKHIPMNKNLKKAAPKVNKKSKHVVPVVHPRALHALRIDTIQAPKNLVQKGNGAFKIMLSGAADPRDLVVVVRPVDPHSFQLENFCSTVPTSGEVSLNIKITRVNCDVESIDVEFIVFDSHMTRIYLRQSISPIKVYTNTKDLPPPKIEDHFVTVCDDNQYVFDVKIHADRLKWGTSNELTFFVVDQRTNIIQKIVRQDQIAPPEQSKTIAHFQLPTEYFNKQYNLHVHYISSEKQSKTKKQDADEENSITLPTVGSEWSHGLHGAITLSKNPFQPTATLIY